MAYLPRLLPLQNLASCAAPSGLASGSSRPSGTRPAVTPSRPMKYQAVTPELRTQMLGDLKAGNFTLNCDMNCAFSWISNLEKLSVMYRANQWENLAETVMQIGYGNDLAYYFLGACAEHMGYYDAAMKFYQFSWALYEDDMLTHHCRDSGEGCGGLDIAELLPVRMQAAGQRQVMSAPLTPQEVAEFHSMLYVKHAEILCSWPISKIVQPELAKYVEYYKQRMNTRRSGTSGGYRKMCFTEWKGFGAGTCAWRPEKYDILA